MMEELLSSSFSITKAAPSVLLFGPGNAGNGIIRQIVDRKDPEIHKELRLCAVNTEGALMKSLFDFSNRNDSNLQRWIQGAGSRLQLFQLDLDLDGSGQRFARGHGSGGNIEAVKSAFDRNVARFDRIFEGVDFVVNIGAAGGGTGSACLLKAAERLVQIKVPFLTMLITPLVAEGEKLALAEEVRKELLGFGPVVVLQNELIPKDLLFESGWIQINEAGPLKLLDAFRVVTQEVGNIINADLEDVKRCLFGQNEVYMGHFETDLDVLGKPSSSLDFGEVVHILTNHPFQDSKVLSYGRRMFVWFDGPWTLGAAEKIQGGIRQALGLNEIVHVKWGIRCVKGEENRKMWVFLMVAGSSGKAPISLPELQAPSQAQEIISLVKGTPAVAKPETDPVDSKESSETVEPQAALPVSEEETEEEEYARVIKRGDEIIDYSSSTFGYPTVVRGRLGKIVGTHKTGLPVEIWIETDLARKWNNAFYSVPPDLETLKKLRWEIQSKEQYHRLLDLPPSEKETITKKIFGFSH